MSDAELPITDDLPMVRYEVVASSTGPFEVSFPLPVDYSSALRVSVNDVETTAFTFTPDPIAPAGYPGGEVELDTAVENSIVKIWRDIKPTRATDYADGPLYIATLNEEFTRLAMMVQDARLKAAMTWRVGDGVPDDDVGDDGDMFLSSSGLLYGPKLGGVWPETFGQIELPTGGIWGTLFPLTTVHAIRTALGLGTTDEPAFYRTRLLDTAFDHVLALGCGENLAANRTLNFKVGAADRTLDLQADVTISPFAATVLDETSATNFRTALGVGPGDQPIFLRTKLLDSGIDHTLALTCGENLSADRVLTFKVGNADRTLELAADTTISAFTAGLLDNTTAATWRTDLGATNVITNGGILATFADYAGAGVAAWSLSQPFYLRRGTAAAADGKDVWIARAANYTGGAGVNNALRIEHSVAATVDCMEWAICSIMDSSNDGGVGTDNVAGYFQSYKRHKNGAVWGIAIEVLDIGGAQTGTYSTTVGLEIAMRMKGAAGGHARFGQHIVSSSQDGAAASMDAGLVISAGDSGGTNYCSITDALLIEGTRLTNLINTDTGNFVVAVSGAITTKGALTINNSQNSALKATIQNSQVGNAAVAQLELISTAGTGMLSLYSATHAVLPSVMGISAPASFVLASVGDQVFSRNGVTAITIGVNTIDFNLPQKLKNYTVGTLPAAATAGAYARAAVSDANAPTYNATVAAGGAVKIGVMSDGANWKCC